MNEFIEMISKLDDEMLARLFDVSRPTIQRWKHGATSPAKAMLPSLVKKLSNENIIESCCRYDKRRNGEQSAVVENDTRTK